jgi:hypothetical protein
MRGTFPSGPMPWTGAPSHVANLFDPKDWQQLFGAVDPYNEHWREDLQRGAKVLATRTWAAVCKAFPDGASAEVVARNTWILLKRKDPSLPRLLEAVLRLGVPATEEIEDVVRGLQGSYGHGAAIPEPHWLEVLLGRSDPDPGQRGVRGLAPELSLKHAHAAALRDGLDQAHGLIAIVGQFPDVSRWALARATREFLARREVTPLPAAMVSQLPPRVAMLLVEQRELKAALLGISEDSTPKSLLAIQKKWQPYRELRKLVRLLVPAIRDRNWAKADELAKRALTLRWQPEVLGGLEALVRDAITSPGDVKPPIAADWPARYPTLVKVLPKIAPNVRAVQILVAQPKTVASRAVRSEKYRVVRALAPVDFAVLQALWNSETIARLFRAGRFDLVPANYVPVGAADLRALVRHADRPAAKAWLVKFIEQPSGRDLVVHALRGRALPLRRILGDLVRKDATCGAFLIPHLGSRVSRGVITDAALSQFALLAQCIEFWAKQPETDAKVATVAALADGLMHLKSARLRLELGQRFLSVEPTAAQILGKRIGAEGLQVFLTTWPAAQARGECWSPEMRTLLAEALIAGLRLNDAESTWAVVGKKPKFVALVSALHWPAVDAGSTTAQVRLALLATRRDWRHLRRIAIAIGSPAFTDAVLDLKPLLPERDRSLAYLELAACLPPKLHGALARAFGVTRFRAAHGCALDDCYTTYPLPKRAGGTRTITVPPGWLRLLQRGLYEYLLRPLGAHDAAHGFVPARSIVTNAVPHVGWPVVVNCDIANCFPSVRWSLVLAALRRDFGQRFAPATISCLVDLCCYRGGLPVGAPTSPAVLNRVLLRTDGFLTEQARRRDCGYTRYADDLTFSGDPRAVGLLRLAASSLARIGLALDPKKTNIYRGGRRQMVTGLVVNRQVSVPRRLRRRMRAAVHAVEQGRSPSWHGEMTTVSSLRGRLAFTQAINPAEAERLVRRLEAAEAK